MNANPINWTATADTDTFEMAGTEKTKTYKGVVKTSRGQLGVRFLPDEDNPTELRIRLEPTSADNAALLAGVLPEGDNPQVPDEWQPRFSVVVPATINLSEALAPAVAALTHGAEFTRFFAHPKLPTFQPASDEPTGETLLAAAAPTATATDDKDALLEKAKKLKVRGVNWRWGVDALKAGIAKMTPATDATT